MARELPGIDPHADGGYIVAPPSVHVSGARYEWLDPHVPIASGAGVAAGARASHHPGDASEGVIRQGTR